MSSLARRNDAGSRNAGFEGLAREFSQAEKTARRNGRLLTSFKDEIEDIARQDYGAALRRRLSRWEVREIAKEGKKRVWPGLNREPVKLVTLDEFVHRWSGFGVDFKFASLPWKHGLSLLGFYVKRMNREHQRPLIFVNTAHHPALVGAALDHEMGHHLTDQIFGSGEDRPSLLSPTAFKEHLTDSAELAADLLVSLAIFPAATARQLLDPANDGVRDDSRFLSSAGFDKALGYIADRYQLRVESIRGTERKCQALAALVHYTKLRRALLDEYNT